MPRKKFASLKDAVDSKKAAPVTRRSKTDKTEAKHDAALKAKAAAEPTSSATATGGTGSIKSKHKKAPTLEDLIELLHRHGIRFDQE
jgi:hypothetical protein